MQDYKAKFVTVIIRTVIAFYACWFVVLIVDFGLCSRFKTSNCDAERSELRGAAMAIPATLLAWLAESPSQAK